MKGYLDSYYETVYNTPVERLNELYKNQGVCHIIHAGKCIQLVHEDIQKE